MTLIQWRFFLLNKTQGWLEGTDDALKIIQQSRREVDNERKTFKQREEIIKLKRVEKTNEGDFLERKFSKKIIEKKKENINS